MTFWVRRAKNHDNTFITEFFINILAIFYQYDFGYFISHSSVTNIDGKQVTVTFVDYGNGETLSSDRLRCLHKDTTSPAMAYYCCLDGCENADPAVMLVTTALYQLESSENRPKQ
jgi:hypothetical protein